MTDAGWAEKVAGKVVESIQAGGYPSSGAQVWIAKALKAEHARAIRLVKALEKELELDQHTYTAIEKDFVRAIYRKVRLRLQRGRGGKG